MECYNSAARALPKKLSDMLMQVEDGIKAQTYDIKLKAGSAIQLRSRDKTLFLSNNGNLSVIMDKNFYRVTVEDIKEAVKVLTNYSLHSSKNQIDNGFITIDKGHRAGLSGSYTGGESSFSVRDFNSINLRIARQIKGVSAQVCNRIFRERLASVLIVGRPSSGKTTLIRDIAYRMGSKQVLGRYINLSVVDTRCELAATYNGISAFDLGETTSVFSGYPKEFGVMTALKTMSPSVIMLDEIGSLSEYEAVRACLNAGVEVIATAHSSTIEQALRRDFIRRAVDEGCFEYIVLIDDGCRIKEISRVGEDRI